MTTIPILQEDIRETLLATINNKTKPLGALGQLESLALQVGLIQNRTKALALHHPTLLVFAADHGIAAEGVSAYPPEVTYQMVLNFLRGGAAINVFCRQHGFDLKITDAGVNYDFDAHVQLIQAKAGYGTANFLHQPAMSVATAEECLKTGARLVREQVSTTCNIVGFGEMGIGNTSSAAVLTSLLGPVPIAQCTGRGTGLDDEAWQRKVAILQRAIQVHGIPDSPLETLATYGGFEIAQMCGAMLEAASRQMILLIDGFIASAAFLVAYRMNPNIRPYAIFCHQSEEKGHVLLLKLLSAKPILNLHLRLGEGTGCALAYPLLESAVRFYNEMANFSDL